MNNIVVGVPSSNHQGKGICFKAGLLYLTALHGCCSGFSLHSQSSWQNSFAHFFILSYVHKSLSLLEDLQLNVVQVVWQLSKEHNFSCSVFSEGTDFSVLWVLIVYKLLFFQWSKKFL